MELQNMHEKLFPRMMSAVAWLCTYVCAILRTRMCRSSVSAAGSTQAAAAAAERWREGENASCTRTSGYEGYQHTHSP